MNTTSPETRRDPSEAETVRREAPPDSEARTVPEARTTPEDILAISSSDIIVDISLSEAETAKRVGDAERELEEIPLDLVNVKRDAMRDLRANAGEMRAVAERAEREAAAVLAGEGTTEREPGGRTGRAGRARSGRGHG
jgi:hypothetical protein